MIVQDDDVDILNNCIIQKLINNVCDEPNKTQLTMSIMAIARSLERIGDHANYIAESAFFLVGGKIVRHIQIGIEINE